MLIILFAALVRIRLLQVPLDRDEGEYAFAGQLLLQGVPPYREAFNMKFPGVYGAYAVIMAVFGQTVAGIHLGLLVINAGTILLVFLLGRRLFSTEAGVASAAAFAVLSISRGVLGMQGHATHFVIAAALGGTLLLLRALDTERTAVLFWSGLLYGVAILMKQHGVFFAIFGGLYLVVVHWNRRRGEWSAMLRKLALYAAGVSMPFVLTGLALWRAGVFAKFWFWTISYAREYALESSLADGWVVFAFAFPIVVHADLLLWILAGGCLVLLWWKHRDHASTVFISGFLLFSFFAVCPGLYFREHYFILVVPAIALLAGATVRFIPKAGWLLFAAVLAVSIARQSDILFRLDATQVSHEIDGLNPFPEAIPIAEYLRTHSPASARIAVLGSEPEIYFYANRRSATGYIYTYGLMEVQPFALKMQNEMIGELEKSRPEFVVFVGVQQSWTARPESNHKIFNWWNAFRAKEYDLVAAADIISEDRTAYYWDNVETHHPQSPRLINIYRRKNN